MQSHCQDFRECAQQGRRGASNLSVQSGPVCTLPLRTWLPTLLTTECITSRVVCLECNCRDCCSRGCITLALDTLEHSISFYRELLLLGSCLHMDFCLRARVRRLGLQFDARALKPLQFLTCGSCWQSSLCRLWSIAMDPIFSSSLRLLQAP